MVTRPLSAVSCLDWCGVWVSKLVMSSYNLERERGLGIEQTCQHKGQTLCLLNLLHELNLDSLPNNMLRRTMLAAFCKHTHTHTMYESPDQDVNNYMGAHSYTYWGTYPSILHCITLHYIEVHYITSHACMNAYPTCCIYVCVDVCVNSCSSSCCK